MPSEDARLLLSAVTIEDYAPLSQTVRIEFDPTTTVLFGRNAAGKSVLIEGIARGFQTPRGTRRMGPRRFRAEFGELLYEYSWSAPLIADEDVDARLPGTWAEKCWRRDAPDLPIWSLENGTALIAGRPSLTIPPGLSLLSFAPEEMPRELVDVLLFCALLHRVQAGIPRADAERTELYLRAHSGQNGTPRWTPVGGGSGRVQSLISVMMVLQQAGHDKFAEFVELGRKLKLFERVEARTFKREGARDDGDLAEMAFDGCNAGLLSDGTLRVIEILWALLGTGSMLLIEEPETAIHPGMLKALLNVVEAYSADRQVVFSTHSPIVVSRARPAQLRLVRRHAGGTTVRSLLSSEIENAAQYLEDEGTLGEFVFTGGLDEDA